jgi:hypothetical protein
MKTKFAFSLWIFLIFCALAPIAPAQSVQPGTQVRVRLLDRLDTGDAKAGQAFSATVAEPVRSGNRVILAQGTTVHGQVIEVVSSGRLKRPASISLQLTDAGRSAVNTETVRIDGKSHLVRNTALIGGGAVAGAILGDIAGGGKGALIGGAVGASAGTATAFMTGKKEIVLPPETELTFAVAGNAVTVAEASAPERSAPRAGSHFRRERDDSPREERDSGDSLVFSEHQQLLIRGYYQSSSGRGLPPGLAKRGGGLPPGLERQVRRNGTLPPGLERRVEPLPTELDRQLPPLPNGCSRVVLSDRALILASDGRILDLMFIYQ